MMMILDVVKRLVIEEIDCNCGGVVGCGVFFRVF
jgi:hypothetical protein